MLVRFSPIFVADTKVIVGYDFVAPLKTGFCKKAKYLLSVSVASLFFNAALHSM